MEQLNLFDYLKDLQTAVERKWDIPVPDQKRRAEEGWIDDWHYTELENPPEPNIYYCIILLKSGHYNYTYMAWAYGHWWNYAGYGTKWLLIETERRKEWMPFAWVRVPDLYFRKDEHYQFLFEHFVTERDWKYEKTMMEIRDRLKAQHGSRPSFMRQEEVKDGTIISV